MTEKEIRFRHNYISDLISKGHLKEAFDELNASGLKGDSLTELQSAIDTYKYMVAYFLRSVPGSVDPSRSDMYIRLRETAFRLNDILLIQALKPGSSNLYFSYMRNSDMDKSASLVGQLASVRSMSMNVDLHDEVSGYDMAMHRELEAAADKLFNKLWTTPLLSKEEEEALRSFMLDEDTGNMNRVIRALLISALLLGALECYDRTKLLLLVTLAMQSDETRIAARCLTAALLLIWKYRGHVASDKEISAAIAALSETDDFERLMRSFVQSMLRTIDTDRINKQMKEELLPEIMRLKPDIEKHIRAMGDASDIHDMEENPAWQKLLDKSGITDKLKNFTELQMDGGDVFMSAFSQMKMFPFFRKISNWFLPFTLRHTVAAELKDSMPSELINLLICGPHFCASDKYSMAQALMRMPRAQFDMMTSQLSSQLGALEEERKTSLGENMKLPAEAEINLYLKDLFRFFRLSPVKDEISDLFGTTFDLPDVAPFSILKEDHELLRSMAEFYFKYGYWDKAGALFSLLADTDTLQEDILQKLGYCLQMKGEYTGAIAAYRKAELLNASSVWLMRHIGACLRLTGHFEEAAACYARAAEYRPDNKGIELALARIYVENGQIADALKLYYKWDYMQEGNPKIIRAIAWCEFLNGNYTKSVARYRSLGDQRTPTDYINTGHALLAGEDVENAVVEYRHAMRMLGSDSARFFTLMEEDTPQLIKAGVPEINVRLIIDGLRY